MRVHGERANYKEEAESGNTVINFMLMDSEDGGSPSPPNQPVTRKRMRQSPR